MRKVLCALANRSAFAFAMAVAIAWTGFSETVTNVRGSHRENSKLVDIYYSLNDSDGGTYYVEVEIVGRTSDVNASAFSGDVGEGVVPGQNLHVVWDAGSDWPDNKGGVMVVVTATKEDDGRPKKVRLWAGGPYWADRNIGADNPWDYGLYFWWGDTSGISSFDYGTYFNTNNSAIFTGGDNISELQSSGWVMGDGVLAQSHDTAHVKWGCGWRMPTEQELSDLNNKCDWNWMTTNGVNGYIVRGKGAYASKNIFLPCAGFGHGTSVYSRLVFANSRGCYWSSVPSSEIGPYRCGAWGLSLDSSEHGTSLFGRSRGLSVRPVQEISNGDTETDSAMTGSSDWFPVDTTVKTLTEVVINFKKDAFEFDQECKKAYWVCSGNGVYTAFPVSSGEVFSMPVGTYTLVFRSGETEFADPEPMQIVLDGTKNRIEKDVILTRKMVEFRCVFYNQSRMDYGMQPGSLHLDHGCEWMIYPGEWHRSGDTITIPTGEHTLTFSFHEGIRLMVGTEWLGRNITIDGTEATHTEYVNALGEKGARVSFGFRGSRAGHIDPFYGMQQFDESRVLITLRSVRGRMILHKGEYLLPQGSYTASFEYDSQGVTEVWSPPLDMTFDINGKDKEFILNFTDRTPMQRINIWFDANGGTVDTPILSYSIDGLERGRLDNVPEPTREDGAKFVGWFTSRDGGYEVYWLPKQDDSGIEFTYNAAGKQIAAVHLYAHWDAGSLWDRISRMLKPASVESSVSASFTQSHTFISYLQLPDDGGMAGTATVKTQKEKNGVSAATVTIQSANGKKQTIKGTISTADGTGQGALAGLKFSSVGVTGTLNGYSVDGTEDVSKSKDAGTAAVLNSFKGKVYTLALMPGSITEAKTAMANGVAGFSVAFSAKGKAKVTGNLPDGTKVSASGQLMLGSEWCCLPVVCSKNGSLSFMLWFDRSGNFDSVSGMTTWKGNGFEVEWRESVAVSNVGNLPGASKFNLEDTPAKIKGSDVVDTLLPIGVPVTAGGAKWSVAKADKVKLDSSGQVAYGENPSALKLTYTAKTGMFKGSFAFYTLSQGKLKKVNATVTGVVVNGIGYGTATVKGVGCWPVSIR